MPIYPRGGTFMVSVGSGANRIRRPAKTEEEAKQLEARLLLEQIANKKAPQVTPQGPSGLSKVAKALSQGKTLKDAYERTMRLHWRGTRAEKTHAINSASVLSILGENTLLTDITPGAMSDMVIELEDLGNSGSTINKKTSCLNMMFKTAKAEGWIEEFPKPVRRKENKHRVRWMDEAEEAKVLALCEHLGLYDLRDYIIVAIDTGFRRGELLGFKSKDFSGGLLHLHAGATKTDEARAVPATKRVTEVLNRRGNRSMPFQELDPHSLRWQWEKIRGLLGMDDDPQFVVHMLRHTCASRLVQRGVPLAVVQKWMGHKKIETTLRYAHLAPDSLLMGVQALEKTTLREAPEMATADF